MRTVVLTSVDAASGFRCGKPQLDAFFERSAGQNQRKRMSSVERATYPESLAKSLPRYAIPIGLIARLAVDERVQGHGLGSLLLSDAEDRLLEVAEHVGLVAIVVDAKDEDALRFYERAGYVALPGQTGWPRRMFVETKTLQRATNDDG